MKGAAFVSRDGGGGEEKGAGQALKSGSLSLL